MTKKDFIHKICAGQYIFVTVSDCFFVTFGFSVYYEQYFVRFFVNGQNSTVCLDFDELYHSFSSLVNNLKNSKIRVI